MESQSSLQCPDPETAAARRPASASANRIEWVQEGEGREKDGTRAGVSAAAGGC